MFIEIFARRNLTLTVWKDHTYVKNQCFIFLTKMKKKRLLILKRKVAVTSSMLSFYENISYGAYVHRYFLSFIVEVLMILKIYKIMTQ